jgi:hypothetical protein
MKGGRPIEGATPTLVVKAGLPHVFDPRFVPLPMMFGWFRSVAPVKGATAGGSTSRLRAPKEASSVHIRREHTGPVTSAG